MEHQEGPLSLLRKGATRFSPCHVPTQIQPGTTRARLSTRRDAAPPPPPRLVMKLSTMALLGPSSSCSSFSVRFIRPMGGAEGCRGSRGCGSRGSRSSRSRVGIRSGRLSRHQPHHKAKNTQDCQESSVSVGLRFRCDHGLLPYLCSFCARLLSEDCGQVIWGPEIVQTKDRKSSEIMKRTPCYERTPFHEPLPLLYFIQKLRNHAAG